MPDPEDVCRAGRQSGNHFAKFRPEADFGEVEAAESLKVSTRSLLINEHFALELIIKNATNSMNERLRRREKKLGK